MVNARGRWLLDMCSSLGLYIANGLAPQGAAQPTCHRHNGESLVDYVLSRDPGVAPVVSRHVLGGLTDHSAILFSVKNIFLGGTSPSEGT